MRCVLLLVLAVPASACAQGSFLCQPAFKIDHEIRSPVEPCVPQPGDIMLRLDNSVFWRVTHYMALAFDPNGSGLVVARKDGSLCVLEAGPFDTMWVRRLDLLPHLKGYADIGRVWIRRRKTPLTAEQSRLLAEFAERADGKRFALGRLGLQLTPFRKRGPLRTCFVGKPVGDQASYYCSELVTEALCAAGILDPERTRPSATYPNDLFFGRSYNLYIDKHLDINCAWQPARSLAAREAGLQVTAGVPQEVGGWPNRGAGPEASVPPPPRSGLVPRSVDAPSPLRCPVLRLSCWRTCCAGRGSPTPPRLRPQISSSVRPT